MFVVLEYFLYVHPAARAPAIVRTYQLGNTGLKDRVEGGGVSWKASARARKSRARCMARTPVFAPAGPAGPWLGDGRPQLGLGAAEGIVFKAEVAHMLWRVEISTVDDQFAGH